MCWKVYYWEEVRARHLPTVRNIKTESLFAKSRFLKLHTYFQGLRLNVAGNNYEHNQQDATM